MNLSALSQREKFLLSIIVPVFNESQALPKTIQRIEAVSSRWDWDWEVIFVDDGSSDSSMEIIRKAHEHNKRFNAVSLARNFGHQMAVSAGMSMGRGNAIVVIDADLQDPPELIGEFVAKWREGYDVVYGVRRKRKEAAWKRVSYFTFYRLMNWLVDFEIPLDSGDFCLMDRCVVDEINALPESSRFIRGLRSWVGFRQCGIPYERDARAAGESKYSLTKLIKLALDGILNFSTRPLSLIAVLGLMTSALSFLGWVFFLLHRLIGFEVFGHSPRDVPGFASVILCLLLIGGVQMFALGVIGEYIGRIYEEVKRRPWYVVRERVGLDENDQIPENGT